MQFEVKEYGERTLLHHRTLSLSLPLTLILTFRSLLVLPKFSVKIDVPPYVLKTDDLININITTR